MNNKYNNILTPVDFANDDSWQTLSVITVSNDDHRGGTWPVDPIETYAEYFPFVTYVNQHISQPMANTGVAS